MAVLVALCLCATAFSTRIVAASGGLGISMEYESKLFDTNEVLEVNILMDASDWQTLLDNAMSETYAQCDVEVAGQTFYRVGIRPKGNTSLSTIVNDPTTDRYSLKLEFDQYVEGQTCFGLDKLILNNNYADATNMKEALIYDMFACVGADASLYNYAKVSVNGEYWGVYLALEAVEDSFLLRNYGTANGELYKPDSMNMGGDRGNRGEMPSAGNMDFGGMDFSNMQSGSFQRPGGDGEMPDRGDFDPSEMFGGGKGGFGGMGGNGGSNLNYSDDDPDSYSTIWEGEVTNTGDADHKRVVEALKNISQGTELARYMDLDNLVKYAAVHIFSVNSDSLSGSMAHNYYLYEADGQLNILPWDYNLAFGGMGMGGGGGATDTVNSPIDDAWDGTNFFDTMMADEEYHAAYYACLRQVADYLQNGDFEAWYTRTRSLIDALVATDPNAFYTYEEYAAAAETLYEVVTLRGQSIRGQLEGSIPSVESEQQASDTLIDASHLDLSVMGTMNMGGGGMSFGGRGEERTPQDATTSATTTSSFNGGNGMSGGFSAFGGGQMPEGFDPSQVGGQMPEGFDPSQFGGQMPGSFGQAGENTNDAQNSDQVQQDSQPQQSQTRPDADAMSNWNFGNQSNPGNSTLLLYGISAIVMLAAFLFALFYRRRPRKR